MTRYQQHNDYCHTQEMKSFSGRYIYRTFIDMLTKTSMDGGWIEM